MVNCSIRDIFFTFCALCPFVIIPSPTFAGEATDLAFIRKVNPITTPKPKAVVRFNPQETSELKLARDRSDTVISEIHLKPRRTGMSVYTLLFTLRYGVYTRIWCIARCATYC